MCGIPSKKCTLSPYHVAKVNPSLKYISVESFEGELKIYIYTALYVHSSGDYISMVPNFPGVFTTCFGRVTC